MNKIELDKKVTMTAKICPDCKRPMHVFLQGGKEMVGANGEKQDSCCRK